MSRRRWSRVKQVNYHGIREGGYIKDEERAKFVSISNDHTTFFNTDGFVVSKNEKLFSRYP